ncbi:MAG: cation diffusion facilitator family transporter [Actinobacteria bacterium]|nr:cation diffusion facilitator family transporter [Actinomycetota bacterium]MBU1493560.1 cation diffusion facilitator family transporter [Actinomycetota bacterium]MBU1865327.1 cation diffusion facilitator family transporter [Actinomycetota bacterium]
MSDHDHDHEVRSGAKGLADRLRRVWGHSDGHDHAHVAPLADTGAAGVRASKVSLAGLGATAALQAVLVAVTGSVALLSDTLHNLTDALTAIPLWIAFALGRRSNSRKFTFGLGRAEDLAGLIIVVAIAVSAGGVAWESVRRLLDPRSLDHIPWVIAAGLIGAAGNELVAQYRIRVGRRISSEALIADGHHARTDALTSLAVVAAGVGAALGADWVDPAAGLVVAGAILVLLRHAGTRVFGRILDAVDPELVDRTEQVAGSVDGVVSVSEVRMRWHGHRMFVTLVAAVDPDITVRQGHEIAQTITHDLIHAFPFTVDALVHIDPSGDLAAHEVTAHHGP